MNLLVQRKWAVKDATIGVLAIDGKFECYTLEDVVRAPGVKVDGQTAIPAGSYKVIIDLSQRFGKRMPHILDVPGFEGIRIHGGNTASDTEGCLLVGQTYDLENASIGASRIAFEALFRKLDGATDIALEIVDL